MTDIELIELAAKAAGIQGRVIEGVDEFNFWLKKLDRFSGRTWAPLTDDGDALRLAVKLRLRLDIFAHEVWVTTQAGKVCDALSTGDENRMVRVAITRAAAEIGKAMP